MKYVNKYCVCTQDPKFEDKTKPVKIFHNVRDCVVLKTGEMEDYPFCDLIELAPDMIDDVIEVLMTLKKEYYE